MGKQLSANKFEPSDTLAQFVVEALKSINKRAIRLLETALPESEVEKLLNDEVLKNEREILDPTIQDAKRLIEKAIRLYFMTLADGLPEKKGSFSILSERGNFEQFIQDAIAYRIPVGKH